MKISNLDNYEIIQNPVLGAHAIWQFCIYFSEYSSENEYPRLIHTLPVLPIVLNSRARDSIKNRRYKEGSLLIMIKENKDIYAGLQERMENMMDLTLESINISLSSKLLTIDSSGLLIANRAAYNEKKMSTEYKDIIYSSRRIGAWFGQLTFTEIVHYFNITF